MDEIKCVSLILSLNNTKALIVYSSASFHASSNKEVFKKFTQYDLRNVYFGDYNAYSII